MLRFATPGIKKCGILRGSSERENVIDNHESLANPLPFLAPDKRDRQTHETGSY
jgi:hypothetical protein